MIIFELRKHFAVLDKITRLLIFYDIISIVMVKGINQVFHNNQLFLLSTILSMILKLMGFFYNLKNIEYFDSLFITFRFSWIDQESNKNFD